MSSEAALLQRIETLEAIEAIRQLKARYLSCCDAKDAAGMRACFADGPVEIDYGAIGRFTSADALVEVFRQIGCHPHMVELHHGVNPQIEVHGERASGRWGLHYALINTREQTFTQLAGVYDDGYARRDGRWQIARTRFVATSTLVLGLGEAPRVLFAGSAPPMPG